LVAVPDLSRSQLLVYAAVAVAVLLVGARFVRSGQGEEAGAPQASFAAEGFEPGDDVEIAGTVFELDPGGSPRR